MSDYPKLLIQKSKHYTSHYLLKNEKDKNKVALKIIKNWMDMGYLSVDKDVPKTFSDYCQKETGMTEAELKALHDDPKLSKVKVALREGYSSKGTVQEEVKKLAQEYKERVSENQVVLKAKEALKKKDGKLAWAVVNHYKDGQYMGTEELSFEEND